MKSCTGPFTANGRAGFGFHFWALWTAAACSNLSDGLFKFFLPVIAARLTDSPSLIAGVTAVSTLPWLLFALQAGAIVDRVDRKRLMIQVNLARAVTIAFLAMAVTFSWASLPALYAAAFLLGICETLSDTAAGSLVPSVVGKANLDRANSRLFAVETTMNQFVGPPLGAALLAFGVGLALGGSAGSYLLAVFSLFMLPGNFKPERISGSPLLSDIREGITFLWKSKLLRTLAIMVGVMAGCWSAYLSLLVLYAVDPGPVGLNELGYSLLLTSIAAGGISGAFLTGPIQRLFGRRWLFGADIVGTFAMLVTPALTTNPWLIGLAAFAGGIGGTTWSVAVASLRQSLVPDELLGRVYGVYRLIGWGTLSIGAALAGFIAELISIKAVFILGAAISICLFYPFAKVLTKERVEAAEAPQDTVTS
jgi:MFS family permease